jgi:hypothetical protein
VARREIILAPCIFEIATPYATGISRAFFRFRENPLARPEFKPTDEQRHKVMLYRAVGMSNRDIAVGIRVDEKTLAKHFARELLHGPAIIRQELLAMVTSQAIEGKKSAIALLERMTRDDRLLGRHRRPIKSGD